MTFSAQAWQAAGPRFAEIMRHPFLRRLVDGTLGEDVFVRYLHDDVHYLNGYARVLATIASRAPDADGIALFAGAAERAIAAELDVHRTYLLPRASDAAAGGVIGATPTCRAYVGMLNTVATCEPVEVAIAAVLPCFRVYSEVGRGIGDPGMDHPYRRWIDAYADPEFTEAVRAVEGYVDRLAEPVSDGRRGRMTAAYLDATRYEWMFWDAAWRAEAWPAPDARGPAHDTVS